MLIYYLPLSSGMAFGTGSAMAHRAVDAVMGPRTIQHEAVVTEATAAAATPMGNAVGSDACGLHSKAFQDVCTSLRFLVPFFVLFFLFILNGSVAYYYILFYVFFRKLNL